MTGTDESMIKAPITGYGDEGAEMLAAAYLADRFDRLEDWLHGQGLKSSFMQDWMRFKHLNVGDRMEAPAAPSDPEVA